MFVKKILIFVVFGVVVFLGSIAVMLLLGRTIKEPKGVVDGVEGVASAKVVSSTKPGTNVNKIIEKMYYKQVNSFQEYDTETKDTNVLLNMIQPAKLINEINKLKDRYEEKNLALQGREEKLKKLQSDIMAERKMIETLKNDLGKDLSMITETRDDMLDSMSVMDAEEEGNMKLLANIYGGMKPKQAAPIISKMDNKTAVKLLRLMDQRNSAKILQNVDPDIAVTLSEQIRRTGAE